MSSILEQLGPLSGKLLARYDSGVRVFEIRERQQYRWLHFGSQALQGALDIRHPSRPLLPYVCAMLLGVVVAEQPQKILSLGLGIGMLERFILSHMPEARLTSIEAEWQVLEIAKEHFFLPQCDVRIAQAEAYLSESREDYDLLFSDLHNGQSSSRSLLTPEFVNSCYRRLNTNGILVVNNLPADLKDMKAVLHELKKVFPYLMCYQVTGFQNVIVFCGKKSFYDKNAILRRIKLLKSPNWLELETIAAGLVYSP